jgi:hypothetical protein
MRNKRGIEMSFATVFAIVVGAVIIFFAIFATTRFIDTERNQQDTEIGKELGILLTPIETNLESANAVKLVMPTETRIYNDCRKLSGEIFGKQDISVSTKSGIGKEWGEQGVPSSFKNKYLFSSDVSEGKEFEIFTKPLDIGFKIADLTFLWSDKEEYCFVNPTRDIENEVTDLALEGIKVVSSLGECSVESEKVCFTRSGCDVDVDVNSKSVKKKKRTETVFYEGPLVYGAILSEPGRYECEVQRLMGRASELASIYAGKSALLSVRDCGSERLQPLLANFGNRTGNMVDSLELREINLLGDEIRRQNENLGCRLF